MEMGYRLKRGVSSVLVLGLLTPLLAGCGGPRTENPPPGNETGSTPTSRPGMSRGQKTALLVGAAALYYLYTHRQQAKDKTAASGPTGQLYRSESTGGIYYRDAQGKPHWVSPPKGGIQVPADEARSFESRNRDQIERTHYKDSYEPLPLSQDESGQYAR